MKTNTEFKVPAPAAGWRWVIGQVKRGDRFVGLDEGVKAMNPADLKTVTEGPRVWQSNTGGQPTFTVSGYIRRIRK